MKIRTPNIVIVYSSLSLLLAVLFPYSGAEASCTDAVWYCTHKGEQISGSPTKSTGCKKKSGLSLACEPEKTAKEVTDELCSKYVQKYGTNDVSADVSYHTCSWGW